MNRGLQSNNTSGHRGVEKKGDKWQVSISKNKKRHYLGIYSSYEEAVSVRKQAEINYFGKYNRGANLD